MSTLVTYTLFNPVGVYSDSTPYNFLSVVYFEAGNAQGVPVGSYAVSNPSGVIAGSNPVSDPSDWSPIILGNAASVEAADILNWPGLADGAIPASKIDGCPPDCDGDSGDATYTGTCGVNYKPSPDDGDIHLDGGGQGILEVYDAGTNNWPQVAPSIGETFLCTENIDTASTDAVLYTLIATSGSSGMPGYTETWQLTAIISDQYALGSGSCGSVLPTVDPITGGVLPVGYRHYDGTNVLEWDGLSWNVLTIAQKGDQFYCCYDTDAGAVISVIFVFDGTDWNPIISTTAAFGANAQATETARGVAEIATQAETDGGTDDERFITPAKLAQSIYTQNITEQATAPTNVQLTWVDNSAGAGFTWPVYRYINGDWRLIANYDSASNTYSAGSATNIVEQPAAPTDTQLIWVNTSTSPTGPYPISLYINGAWTVIGEYDPSTALFSIQADEGVGVYGGNANLRLRIQSLTPDTAMAANDQFVFYDAADQEHKRITRTALESSLNVGGAQAGARFRPGSIGTPAPVISYALNVSSINNINTSNGVVVAGVTGGFRVNFSTAIASNRRIGYVTSEAPQGIPGDAYLLRAPGTTAAITANNVKIHYPSANVPPSGNSFTEIQFAVSTI